MRAVRYLISITILVVVVAQGQAHERVELDPDDSPGPLDIVAAAFRHVEGQDIMRVVTYEEWGDDAISDEMDYVRFDFATSHHHPKCIVVRNYPSEENGAGAIYGWLYRWCGAPLPYNYRVVRVDGVVRPDLHTLEVTLAPRFLWPKAKSIRWNAMTSFEGDGYPGCEPPEHRPPEHFVGNCSDTTAPQRHRRH